MSITSKQSLGLLVPSGIGTELSWLFYFKALQIGHISQVAAVDQLSTSLAIALSIIYLKETLDLKTAIEAGLIIVETIVLTFR